MIRIVRKLAHYCGFRALLVLGPAAYLRYLFCLFRTFPATLRTKGFRSLDRVMGAKPIKVNVNGGKIIIDCPYTDQRIVDGTYTFGIMREMYIGNCYLRYGVSKAAQKARTVLDLGANRGAFSVMMARNARLVVAAEFNPIFRDVIAHNMEVNGFKNYEIETVFIGAGGKAEGSKSERMTIPDILRKHNIEVVDLLKMDIEGNEFVLFRSPQWLAHVSALCMEVHVDFGDPQEILTALERYAFEYVVTDPEFRLVKDLRKANYIYAWKSGSDAQQLSKKG